MARASSLAKRIGPRVGPLRSRIELAKILNRVPGHKKEALILALLHDWASREPAEYHRFLWSHHLSYARYYDTRQIDFERPNPLRLELMDMVVTELHRRGVSPDRDVESFLDVGCSLGHLVYHAETELFRSAHRLVGVDIDETAVAEGTAYLAGIGSSANLSVTDLTKLPALLGSERFDVVTATGVLQYLGEREAGDAIAMLLERTSRLLAVSGPAWQPHDNLMLAHLQLREYDCSLVHNFDQMVEDAGGRVVARRWGGEERVLDNTIYLVVAEPGR